VKNLLSYIVKKIEKIAKLKYFEPIKKRMLRAKVVIRILYLKKNGIIKDVCTKLFKENK